MTNTLQSKHLNVEYHWTAKGVELRGCIPARLTQVETAELFGITCSDLRALKQAKLLSPCGHDPKKRRKQYNTAFYSTRTVVACMSDPQWMDVAQHAMSEYNAKNNNRLPDKGKEG